MDSAFLALFDLVFTVIGRVAVWMFSLGRWRGEPLGGDEGRIYAPAGALSFTREGRRVITHTGQLFAGVAFSVVLAVLGIAYAAAV